MNCVLAGLILGGAASAQAAVKPHGLFCDGVVLQQGVAVPIWGTADEGEQVTVRFQEQEVSTIAQNGQWLVRLAPLEASPLLGGSGIARGALEQGRWTRSEPVYAGYTLTIAGQNVVEVKNVLVGEVWICSGQSNMQMPLTATENATQTMAQARDPMLRLFTVTPRAEDEPQREVVGSGWQECDAKTAGEFSAVGYYFGRELRRKLNVPIGLIDSSLGGTPAEAWTSRRALAADTELHGILDKHSQAVRNFPKELEDYKEKEPRLLERHAAEVEKAKKAGKPLPKSPEPPTDPAASTQRPCALHNAMIAPLQPFAIRGGIWYQGETNAGRFGQYRTLFSTMIQSWRAEWGQGEFPFLFVQLAPFQRIQVLPTDSRWARLREAQLQTSLTVPRTAMAVITDAGDEKDIHPRKKEPVGVRLALAARALAYGEKVAHSGPLFEAMRIEGDRAILTFTHLGGGLVAKDGELKGFTVAGEDKHFYTAEARIKGNTVVVSHEKVANPVAVRFGWQNCPVVNLFNKAGLPASPFRTDDWPMGLERK
jgi:sialate O-acetylesterase